MHGCHCNAIHKGNGLVNQSHQHKHDIDLADRGDANWRQCVGSNTKQIHTVAGILLQILQ